MITTGSVICVYEMEGVAKMFLKSSFFVFNISKNIQSFKLLKVKKTLILTKILYSKWVANEIVAQKEFRSLYLLQFNDWLI